MRRWSSRMEMMAMEKRNGHILVLESRIIKWLLGEKQGETIMIHWFLALIIEWVVGWWYCIQAWRSLGRVVSFRGIFGKELRSTPIPYDHI